MGGVYVCGMNAMVGIEEVCEASSTELKASFGTVDRRWFCVEYAWGNATGMERIKKQINHACTERVHVHDCKE
jgi:hypothetical protein